MYTYVKLNEVYFPFEYYNPIKYDHLEISNNLKINKNIKSNIYLQVVCQQKLNVVDLVVYLLCLVF